MRPLLLVLVTAALIVSCGRAAKDDNLPEPWRPGGNQSPPKPTCSDGVQNQDEIGVDCGGLCPVCIECASGKDCASGRCTDGRCQKSSCSDGVQNQGEEGIDCDGPCKPCKRGCTSDAECAPGICRDGECISPSCLNGSKDGDETDVDCGGSCAPCYDGSRCDEAGDCWSKSCTNRVCRAATCTDGARNQDETDVDCGGLYCRHLPCGAYSSCDVDEDCQSTVCDDHSCQPSRCTDLRQNGQETDVDCGGPYCGGCDEGSICTVDEDCLSGTCNGGHCSSYSCADGSQNGSETDVDCGGDCPNACADGSGCATDADCSGFACNGGVCEAPTCWDGRRNGTEEGVDCGIDCGVNCPDRRFGINIDLDQTVANPDVSLLKALHVGFVRLAYRDRDLNFQPDFNQPRQSPAELDPTRLQLMRQKLELLQAEGIEVLVVLNYDTWWGKIATRAGKPVWWGWYEGNFAQRAGAIARELGTLVTAYEVWNEPDLVTSDPGYQPYISEDNFSSLLTKTSQSIRRYSRATIVSGGVASGDVSYLNKAATGIAYVDAVGIHPYGNRPDPDYPNSTWMFNDLETSVTTYATFGKPLWITEIGVEYPALPGIDAAEQRLTQGEFLRRTFQRTVDLESYVARTAWFAWSDHQHVGPIQVGSNVIFAPDGFGIVDVNGNETPSYKAFQLSANRSPATPSLSSACFQTSQQSDGTWLVTAEFAVDVPEEIWTQPMGTSASQCSAYGPGETAQGLYPGLKGLWRVGASRDGVDDYPWRFALKADLCIGSSQQVNRGLASDAGSFTITGRFTLQDYEMPRDGNGDADLSAFTGGLVQEELGWAARDVGCQTVP